MTSYKSGYYLNYIICLQLFTCLSSVLNTIFVIVLYTQCLTFVINLRNCMPDVEKIKPSIYVNEFIHYVRRLNSLTKPQIVMNNLFVQNSKNKNEFYINVGLAHIHTRIIYTLGLMIEHILGDLPSRTHHLTIPKFFTPFQKLKLGNDSLCPSCGHFRPAAFIASTHLPHTSLVRVPFVPPTPLDATATRIQLFAMFAHAFLYNLTIAAANKPTNSCILIFPDFSTYTTRNTSILHKLL